MRHYIKLFFASMLCTFAIASCVKEIQQPEQQQEDLHEVVFHAGWDDETKTVLQEDGRVFWEPGDEISLFVGDGTNGGYKLTSTNTEPAAKSDFVGMIENFHQGDAVTAVYPFDERTSYDYPFLYVTLPKTQVAKEGSFDSKAFFCVAVASDNHLFFKNVCSGVKLIFSSEKIRKVKIAGGWDQAVSGQIQIVNDAVVGWGDQGDFGSLDLFPPDGKKYFEKGKPYYAVIPALSYAGGMSFLFYTDDSVGAYDYTDWVDFKPSVFKRVYEKDGQVTYKKTIPDSYAVVSGPLVSIGAEHTNKVENIRFVTGSDYKAQYESPYYWTEYIDNPRITYEFDGNDLVFYTKAEKIKVLNAATLFYNFHSLKSADLSSFDTSDCGNFHSMFQNCYNLQSLDLSSFDTSSAKDMSFMFSNCKKLKGLDLSNFDTGNVQSMEGMFFECSFLEKLNINSFSAQSLTNIIRMFFGCYSLTGLDMGQFDLSRVVVTDFACQGLAKYSRMCAIRCAPETQTVLSERTVLRNDYAEFISPSETMPDYSKREDPTLYYSKSFLKDKEVKILHQATQGKGVNVVFMGDAYSDRLVEDGTYDRDIKMAVDAVFSKEPYKSFKNLFNIYQVTAVSVNEVAGENTVFDTFSDIDLVIHWSDIAIKEYINSIPGIDSEFNVPTMVIVNGEPGLVAGAAGHDYGWGYNDTGEMEAASRYDRCVVFRKQLDEDYKFTASHEFGHCFGYLADEYTSDGSIGATLNQWTREFIPIAHQMNMEMNVDITNDSNLIIWKHFLTDSRYSSEGLGIFQGGYNSMATDIWRPSDNSIMNTSHDSFNAPSREAIYKRIHELAYGKDWQYDYETFVQQDLKNIPSVTSMASVKPVPYPARVIRKPLFKMEEYTTPDGKKMVTVIMD